MPIETEQLKLRLIESQMQVLQYQHRDVTANIETLAKEAKNNENNQCKL